MFLRFYTFRVCLFHASSIYENITYGLEEGEFTEEDVYTSARQACAHDFISGFAGETCDACATIGLFTQKFKGFHGSSLFSLVRSGQGDPTRNHKI